MYLLDYFAQVFFEAKYGWNKKILIYFYIVTKIAYLYSVNCFFFQQYSRKIRKVRQWYNISRIKKIKIGTFKTKFTGFS